MSKRPDKISEYAFTIYPLANSIIYDLTGPIEKSKTKVLLIFFSSARILGRLQLQPHSGRYPK
jgi:hypothetical protein